MDKVIKYVGLDAHKKFCYATSMDKSGNIIDQGRFLTTNSCLGTFINEIGSNAKVVVEASTSGLRVYDYLDANDTNIIMAHPLKLKAIASAKVKTDKIDSEVLANLLRTDFIPEAYVPPREIRDLRGLVRHRTAVVKVRTSLKNRVHSILTLEGVDYDFSDLFGKAGRELLGTLKLRKYNRVALDNYLTIIDDPGMRIKEVTELVDEVVDQDENSDAKTLAAEIKGLGTYTALLCTSEIGDINRFPEYKKLSSYAGLIPSTSSSGGVTRHGKITKQGNKLLRWALVQAAWRVIRYDANLRDFYNRLKKKKGSSKAITATARKLLKKIYFKLKDIQEDSTNTESSQSNSSNIKNSSSRNTNTDNSQSNITNIKNSSSRNTNTLSSSSNRTNVNNTEDNSISINTNQVYVSQGN